MNLSENDIRRPLGRFVIFLFFFFFVFSCVKKNRKEKVSSSKSKIMLNCAVEEARHFDVPVPVGYQFVELDGAGKFGGSSLEGNKTDFLCYLGDLSLDRVLNYYCKNMERYGWKIADFSTKQEGLLFCSKGNKDCIISIRENMHGRKRNSRKSCICLFIKNKLQVKDKVKDINSKKVPSTDFVL